MISIVCPVSSCLVLVNFDQKLKFSTLKFHNAPRVMLISCLLAASWAQAATFQMTFFDTNNAVVGTGEFSVAFGSNICVESNPVGNCAEDPNSLNVVVFKNPMFGFSATIQGRSWSGFGFPSWWAAEGQSAGQQLISRSGPLIGEGGWFFGDPFFNTESLLLGIGVATNVFGSGGWSQSFSDPGVPGGFSGGSGTWTATATPVPAAVWLFISGLGMLGVFNRKRQ